MSKSKGSAAGAQKVNFKRAGGKKKTSIGMSNASRPNSKAGRRDFKPYRGQGKV